MENYIQIYKHFHIINQNSAQIINNSQFTNIFHILHTVSTLHTDANLQKY